MGDLRLRLEAFPTEVPGGFAVANNTIAVAHAVVKDGKKLLPLCKMKHSGDVFLKSEPFFTESLDEAKHYTLTFCRECRPKLIYSLQHEVAEKFMSAGASSSW